MSKFTSITDAIKIWEEKNEGKDITEELEVGLQGMVPPIEKMDNSLSILKACQKLSLSTNMIEKIAGLNQLNNLKILSLGRNNIKNLTGLEIVASTLEELWIPYNFIEKLTGICVLQKLKVLFISNNYIKEWTEFEKLRELPLLEVLLFIGNPLYESFTVDTWKIEARKRLPNIKQLDGDIVIKDE